ncbi:MAG TPA: hypothetical protein VHH36_03725, partial [Candidatus Thermoplasmatota archaeon]|nr:hypothetical protein [Candidatus Thermoplasmatota archaeon]
WRAGGRAASAVSWAYFAATWAAAGFAADSYGVAAGVAAGLGLAAWGAWAGRAGGLAGGLALAGAVQVFWIATGLDGSPYLVGNVLYTTGALLAAVGSLRGAPLARTPPAAQAEP